MTDSSARLAEAVALVSVALEALMASEPLPIGACNPPERPGVYAFWVDGELVYVCEAKGSGGLRDRILKKHVSGDESHALQRLFEPDFPDRKLRREHIKRVVHVQWVVVEAEAVSTVERMAIWLFKPPLNRA